MEATDQNQALALKVKSTIKILIIFFFFLFAVSIAMDYDGGSLMTYFIFFFAFYVLHKIMSKAFCRKIKEAKKTKSRLQGLNYVALFFVFLVIMFVFSIKLFSSKGEYFLNLVFLILYIALGFFLANIEMWIIYSCDRKLELLNKDLLKKRYRWENQVNYFHLFGMYYLEKSLFFVFVFIISVFNLSMNPRFHETIWDVVIFFCGMTFFLVLFNFVRTRYPDIALFKTPENKYISIAIVSSICLFFIGTAISDLNYYYITQVVKIPSILEEAGVYHDYYSYNTESVTAHLVHFFTIILIAPFVEELFFRGFLYNLIKKQYGITAGIIISTAVFALVHYNTYYRFIPILLTCIAMPYLYEKSRSLIPPIIMHAVHNFLVIIL